MSLTRGPRLVWLLAFAAGVLLAAPALAQIAHHPFAIGANEGAVGRQGGFGTWILAQESRFYLGLTGAVRASHESWVAEIGLIGLSFAYGVFHAAGPGHGKAVLTSYMVSNEVALRRGLAIAGLAALLQGVVATVLVGVAALVFHATAQRMTAAAQAAELASYLGIVALGLMLVWRKGAALIRVLRPAPALAFAGSGFGDGIALPASSRFMADGGHAHGSDCDCGHAHFPDAALVSASRFDVKAAGLAIATAGARPCSGAILVLVFAATQGSFLQGVAATFAMAIGTALTTGALATLAVFAKDLALRLSRSDGSRAMLVGRIVEFAAAAGILLFGIALLAAALVGGNPAAS